MPLELAKVLSALDTDREFETEEEFQEWLTQKYVAREIAASDPDIKAKVTGKVLGSLTTKLNQVGGLTKSETEGKKIEEVIDLVAQKHKAELEAAKQAQGTPDEQVKKLQEQLGLEKNKAIEAEKQTMTLAQQLEAVKAEKEKELKQMKIALKIDEIEKQIPFLPADKIPPVAKKGFKLHLQENYIFALSEDETDVEVTDKQGNKILNEKKTAHLTAQQVILMEADRNGLIQKSNGGGDPKKVEVSTTTTIDTGNKKVWNAHPNVVAARQASNA